MFCVQRVVDVTEVIDVAVIGGGAAGFFGAIACAESAPESSVVIFEQSSRVLTKVRISGGGRCNVTHDCYVPDEMAKKHYPRGDMELIGPMYRFGVTQTVAWFWDRDVELKTEDDGRLFPTTDDSQTIIDCLEIAADEAGVEVRTSSTVDHLEPTDGNDGDGRFRLDVDGQQVVADNVLVATGGIRLSKSASMADEIDHELIEARPSLFTFDIDDARIDGLEGISVQHVECAIDAISLDSRGPLLVTHRGLSGPAILEMSARGARDLYDLDYHFELSVDWLCGRTDVEQRLVDKRDEAGGRQVRTLSPFEELPNRLWAKLVDAADVPEPCRWASLSAEGRRRLVDVLTDSRFEVTGKSTHKEEFVTAGGIDTDELNMRTMESKFHPGLYFAGEVVNIDGITGGFNFQAAWTTGYLAGQSIAH